MSITVLTAKPDVGSVARLAETAAERGIPLRVVNALEVVARVDATGSGAVWRGRNELDPRPSCVLARIGNWRPATLLSLLEVFESAGVSSPNPASAIRCGRDHWSTVRALAAVDIPVPRTLAGADPESLARAAAKSLRFPVVVKARHSRMGVGVVCCHALDHLEAVLDSLWRVGEEMVVQEFVGPPGRSVRALVVERRVIAAAEFASTSGEWRSNGARGAAAEPLSVTDDQERLAVGAAAELGLAIAGVDLLHGPDGPVVCEVNPTPGFIRLERATGTDVAGAMVEALWARRPG